MSSFLSPIPEIDRSTAGPSWTQPDHHTFAWDHANERVTISEKDFNELHEYSASLPSGVYPGKMWKAEYQDGWYLRWFGVVEGKPSVCSTHSYKLFVETEPGSMLAHKEAST